MADEVNLQEEIEATLLMQPRTLRQKLVYRCGCLLMIAIWLILLPLPCAFVTLLVEKEVVFHRSDLPEHDLRLFLLDSADQRGFGFSRGSIKSGGEDEGAYCIVTSVDYLMWKGEAEEVDYCNCYEEIEGQWSSILVGGDRECNPVDFSAE